MRRDAAVEFIPNETQCDPRRLDANVRILLQKCVLDEFVARDRVSFPRVTIVADELEKSFCPRRLLHNKT